MMKQTPLYKSYAAVAPHPDQFPLLLDRMGELMKKDYDRRPEIVKLRVPTLLLFADHDAVSMRHIAEPPSSRRSQRDGHRGAGAP